MNNLTLIVGEDKKLLAFYLTEVLQKIPFDNDNKITYDLNEYSLSDILDEASMMSLISNTKVIIGNNLDIAKINSTSLDYLSKYVNNINKDAYIILIAQKIDARLKAYKTFKDNFDIIDTTKLNNQDELVLYIKQKISQKNYQLDQINIDYFLSKVGDDINNIDSELTKLMIYKEDSKIITKEDIDLLVIDNIDNVIYEFTNAILEGNLDIVAKMYNNFKIENVSKDYLIVSLSNVFRQALIIKMLSNSGKSNLEISKVINKKEFYVKKMLERLYNYTTNDIGNFINELAEIDKNYKLGSSNIDELELFLINMKH